MSKVGGICGCRCGEYRYLPCCVPYVSAGPPARREETGWDTQTGPYFFTTPAIESFVRLVGGAVRQRLMAILSELGCVLHRRPRQIGFPHRSNSISRGGAWEIRKSVACTAGLERRLAALTAERDSLRTTAERQSSVRDNPASVVEKMHPGRKSCVLVAEAIRPHKTGVLHLRSQVGAFHSL